MIFVTIGTCEPFDRLLRAVDALDVDEPLVVQHGISTVRPHGATCVDFLAFDELVEHMRAARLVVTHGGVGSVLVAIRSGKRPIVVPRSQRFGDAVDDHQLPFARRMHEAGRILLVEDDRELGDALRADEPQALAPGSVGGGSLALELRRYLAEHVPGPGSALAPEAG
jgi:UDP-N-acetylglucosamine transferase subunit ALG13